MAQFLAHFKPTDFYPVPSGTILRYRGDTYNKDTDRYSVWMDVIGDTPKDWKKSNNIVVIGDTIEIPVIRD